MIVYDPTITLGSMLLITILVVFFLTELLVSLMLERKILAIEAQLIKLVLATTEIGRRIDNGELRLSIGKGRKASN